MNKEKMQDIKERLDLFPSNMNELAQKAYCELFDYINHLEQKVKEQKEVIDKAIELLGNYKHYSTLDEKQNGDNEDLVNNAFDTLKEVPE